MHAVGHADFGVQEDPSERRVVSLPATDLMSFVHLPRDGRQSDDDLWRLENFGRFGVQLARFATLQIVVVCETIVAL
jgi:hypothetical protein